MDRADKIGKALKNERSLEIFLRNIQEFDEYFCRNMFSGKDFTLKFEVHGAKRELIHCRVHNDCFERPSGSKKR